ncbi:hypothetical protein [Psychrobacillus lasiicapitis]|nr:hypothetical protein [Psychrobacillus lasiicapitis]GGA32982.1 hypothetical protein GCM10011384_23210 [Psychrobacillus lasiicapitis]
MISIFIKTRKILGDSLELDGYCELPNQLKIAFEYQGEQHYKFNKYFHGNADGFMKQIILDLEKRHRCKELNIHLIEIPYNHPEELSDFIKHELIKRNIPYNEKIEISTDSVYRSKSKIAYLKSLAKLNSGELLTNHYEHYLTKLDFKCHKGHTFQLKPYELEVLGKWCKHCNSEKRRQIHFEELLKIVHEREGTCLSNEFIDSKTPLVFRCKEGHKWHTIPYVIKGHWCTDSDITIHLV